MSSLAELRPGALDVLASIVAGAPVHVVLEPRLIEAATICSEARTIFLDPGRCELYDLLFCAALIKYPARNARRLLAERFPGVRRMRGCFLRDFPSFTRRQVRLRRLGAGDFRGLRMIPEIRAADDLRACLASDRLPLSELPELPELFVARLPVSLEAVPASPEVLEELHDLLDSVRREVAAFIRCYTRSAEGVVEAPRSLRRRFRGTRLDAMRLHEVAVAARRGRQVRAFRDPRQEIEGAFEPSEHLSVVAFDLGSFARVDRSLRLSKRFAISIVRSLELLGVDFAIVGFADRVVYAPPRGATYLQLVHSIKEASTPMDPRAWARLIHAMRPSPALGSPSASTAAHFRVIEQIVDRAAELRAYKYFSLYYLGPRGLGVEFESAEYWSRTAAAIETIVTGLEARWPGRWTRHGVIPPALELSGWS